MREILTQAPIQIRPDTLDRHERLIPILVVEAIKRINEYETGKEQKRVDIWNTMGSKIDVLYLQSNGFNSRAEFCTDQIERRYHLIETVYGIQLRNRQVLRDDDAQYQQIVLDKVKQLVDRGSLGIYEESFLFCDNCKRCIAPEVAAINDCKSCRKSDFSTRRKKGMFMVFSANTISWIKGSTSISPNSMRQKFISNMNNFHNIQMVSKERDFGISLEEFAVGQEFKLDPKFAIAMSSVVARESGIGDIATILLGNNAMINFIPYAQLFDSNIDFIGMGLIPPYKSANDAKFYFPFLSSILISAKNNLNDKALSDLQKEFAKTVYKYNNSMRVLEGSKDLVNEQTNSEADDHLQLIGSLLTKYQTRDAVLELRDFVYRHLSKVIVEDFKNKGLSPSEDLLVSVRTLMKLLYGV